MRARFVSFEEVARRFTGKRVALLGSGPSVLENEPGFVDGHDVVVRVNNYKTGPQQGYRCDVHYSFYGHSIKKTSQELEHDGVQLCMCKCPDEKAIESEWHERRRKLLGIDFRYIYEARRRWWFCDTFVPSKAAFLDKFEMLDRHIPTTGFSGIVDVLACHPESLYLTGFDFFSSGIHNVNERWRPGDAKDPIGHRPDLEAKWIASNTRRYRMSFDKKMKFALRRHGL